MGRINVTSAIFEGPLGPNFAGSHTQFPGTHKLLFISLCVQMPMPARHNYKLR